ncbi:hypothetical protein NE865_12555 [Phthorimaea operculella]|nr:hypothetical protein NE865_12555 [Phthorimaea operculella]
MDNTALLAKSVKDLAAWMDSRMAEFEKNSQLAGSAGTPKVKDLTTEYLSFKSTVLDTLAMLRAQLELVVYGLDRLETHSRRKVLLFHGVPEAESEDLPKKLDTIFRDQMKMTSVGSEVIEVCHRLGAKRDKNRPVLVRFSTATHRSAVWNAKTKLKGSKMSISEFLTKPRQDIFSKARDHFGVKNSWSSDGVIVVLLPDKTRKKLVTMAELEDLIKQYPDKCGGRSAK